MDPVLASRVLPLVRADVKSWARMRSLSGWTGWWSALLGGLQTLPDYLFSPLWLRVGDVLPGGLWRANIS